MFSHAPWLVYTVFGLTLIWLSLVVYFFHYLKSKQPDEFVALGRPSFQSRGSSLRSLSYIYRRGHAHLKDRHFSLLCDLMVVIFSLVVVFAGFAFISNGAFPSWQSAR